MKAISIRQPWASLTAAGIRDIDISNRDTHYRGPVLLVASARRVGRDFGHDIPTDWYCRVRNAQALGLIPYDEELPVSCAVGLAHLTDCTATMQNSPWSAMGNNWVLRDAQLFTNPIFGVKGKQGLFEVTEVQEEHLPPSISLPTPWSSYADGTLSLSMTEAEIERQIPHWPLVLMVCHDGLAQPVLQEGPDGDELRPIHQVRLVSTQSEVTFGVAQAQLLCEAKEDNDILYIALHLTDRLQDVRHQS